MKNGNGLIKVYDDFGNIRFEGEFINGERNGKGKEYDYDGRIEFEGGYLHGEKSEYGKEYFGVI